MESNLHSQATFQRLFTLTCVQAVLLLEEQEIHLVELIKERICPRKASARKVNLSSWAFGREGLKNSCTCKCRQLTQGSFSWTPVQIRWLTWFRCQTSGIRIMQQPRSNPAARTPFIYIQQSHDDVMSMVYEKSTGPRCQFYRLVCFATSGCWNAIRLDSMLFDFN